MRGLDRGAVLSFLAAWSEQHRPCFPALRGTEGRRQELGISLIQKHWGDGHGRSKQTEAKQKTGITLLHANTFLSLTMKGNRSMGQAKRFVE